MERWQAAFAAQMQNAECKMQNGGIGFADEYEMVSEGNTIILHFAFLLAKQKFNFQWRNLWPLMLSFYRR